MRALQGWDDLGVNNPLVQTPNLDELVRGGVLFDNYYTDPQCAQSRTSLFTGRHHARLGVMRVHGGYDFIPRTGQLLPEMLRSVYGYRTVHHGKYHNADILGYGPWNNGAVWGFGGGVVLRV